MNTLSPLAQVQLAARISLSTDRDLNYRAVTPGCSIAELTEAVGYTGTSPVALRKFITKCATTSGKICPH